MATIEAGIRPADGAGSFALGRWASARSRWIAEVFDGADEALAALEAVQGELVSTGFQTLNWLTVLYEEMAASRRAVPRVVVVSDDETGGIAMILPLLVTTEQMLKVARFADLGVSDYGGPILGPAQIKDPAAIRRIWRAARKALSDVDIIRLERMPAEIGGRPNPLITRSGLTPARQHGTQIVIADSVENYLRGLGKKFRKEAERCHRVWQQEAMPRFYRAMDADDIARVYSALDEQQAQRHTALGSKNDLDQPVYHAFYERLAVDGSEAGLVALFALEAKGKIIATLFGMVHDDTFTLLRLSTAGSNWSYLSPGRLIIVEAMKYFVAQGIRRFELGIGDHPFKRGFEPQTVPLHDLIVATHLAGTPVASYHRLKGRVRQHRGVRAMVGGLKPLLGLG